MSLKTVKKTVLVRAAVICVSAACLIFLTVLFFSDPINKDFYGVFVHSQGAFHCPACGLTRAVYCAMHLDFRSAFYYHAYFTALFPVLTYIAVCLAVNLFFGRKIVPYPKNAAVGLYTLLALLVVFTIVRNFSSAIY